LAVFGVVSLSKSRSTDALVIIDEVDAVAERITRIIFTFVQFYGRSNTAVDNQLFTHTFV